MATGPGSPGPNVVGLRRNGYTQEHRNTIKAVYRTVFRSGLPRARSPRAGRAGLSFPADKSDRTLHRIQPQGSDLVCLIRLPGNFPPRILANP